MSRHWLSQARAARTTSWLTAVCLAAGAVPPAEAEVSTAQAAPLTGITIDGRLDDWPAWMVAYSIEEVSTGGPPFGDPPEDPADFTGRFHTGYDGARGVLYVAVVVEDDELGSPFRGQDGCAISVDGDRSGFGDPRPGAREEQHYFLRPGPGRAGWTEGGPHLSSVDIDRSGVEGAVRRLGTTTVYEWGIPLFRQYPDHRLQVTAGDTIGFHVFVTDADGASPGSWLSWASGNPWSRDSGPSSHLTFLAADDVADGEPVPVAPPAPDEVAQLRGTVRMPDGEPFAGQVPMVMRDGRTVAYARTDDAGDFHFELLPGGYAIAVTPGLGAERSRPIEVTVEGQTRVELVATPLRIPDELRQVAARYAGLRTYRDSTVFTDRDTLGMVQSHGASLTTLTFERPNHIRAVECDPGGERVVVSDGKVLTAFDGGWQQYTTREAPDVLSPTDVRVFMPMDGLVLRLLLHEDPLAALTEGVVAICRASAEPIDGMQTTLFEINRFPSTLHMSMPWGSGHEPVTVRMWVGADHLIRQVAVEQDASDMAETASVSQWPDDAKVHKLAHRHGFVEVDSALPADVFVFEAPDGARLVERFSPSGR